MGLLSRGLLSKMRQTLRARKFADELRTGTEYAAAFMSELDAWKLGQRPAPIIQYMIISKHYDGLVALAAELNPEVSASLRDSIIDKRQEIRTLGIEMLHQVAMGRGKENNGQ